MIYIYRVREACEDSVSMQTIDPKAILVTSHELFGRLASGAQVLASLIPEQMDKGLRLDFDP